MPAPKRGEILFRFAQLLEREKQTLELLVVTPISSIAIAYASG